MKISEEQGFLLFLNAKINILESLMISKKIITQEELNDLTEKVTKNLEDMKGKLQNENNNEPR